MSYTKIIIIMLTNVYFTLYRTGPLVNTWCMRMEAKNSYFKQAARGSNFKNVPYSVAIRHQRLLCSYLQCENFFDLEIECGPGKPNLIRTGLIYMKISHYFAIGPEPKPLYREDPEIVTKIREMIVEHHSELIHR